VCTSTLHAQGYLSAETLYTAAHLGGRNSCVVVGSVLACSNYSSDLAYVCHAISHCTVVHCMCLIVSGHRDDAVVLLF